MFICYKTYYITNCKSTVTNRMRISHPYYIIKRKIFLIKTIPKSYSKQYNNSYDINEKNLQQKARRLSTWPFKNYY